MVPKDPIDIKATHEEEDKKEKEKIEARNKADNLVYVAEKSLKDAGDKVNKDLKEEIEKKMKEKPKEKKHLMTLWLWHAVQPYLRND